MLGWINDCIEKLVIDKFGVDTWHVIKLKAGCEVEDGGFLRLEHYSDKSTLDLVMAASAVSGLSAEKVLEVFGEFFVHYIRNEGYDNLLCCQGSTLKDWMSNINAIHQHLQNTFPKKMIMPQFWVEDDDESGDGSLILHYHSRRGNYLAPVGKGLVTEIAKFQFKVEIDMTMLRKQGEDGAEFTSWRVTAKDRKDQWKLTKQQGEREGVKNAPTSFKCPFTGMTARLPATNSERRKSGNLLGEKAKTLRRSASRPRLARRVKVPRRSKSTGELKQLLAASVVGMIAQEAGYGASPCDSFSSYCDSSGSDNSESEEEPGEQESMGLDLSLSEENSTSPSVATCPYHATKSSAVDKITKPLRNPVGSSNVEWTGSPEMSSASGCDLGDNGVGLASAVLKSILPYHVMIDENFQIVQVGQSLPRVLCKEEDAVLGQYAQSLFIISQPVGMLWNWEFLRMLEDQSFDLVPMDEALAPLRFKGSVVHVCESPPTAMIMLNPNANNLVDLREMNLTLSDLSIHGAYRDAVFLREHLSTQMNSALKMEKLSKSLTREKLLLESLLPEHAAEGLRQGKSVEPLYHNNVTFFFSDVEGFTSICDQIYPWQVIDMLNRLYSVMDFLCMKFNLFKVETIGDAYVCCSGLPKPDENHAKNVANFAVAVTHCVKQVLSPVDGAPIKLRIGIHTGPCASGIVGITNPRYCVFGDTVNTTARHESSGAAGQIHCSNVFKSAIEKYGDAFLTSERGLVHLKGKGHQLCHWLQATETNDLVNKSALLQLDQEVQKLLEEKNFDNFSPGKRKSLVEERRNSLRDSYSAIDSSQDIEEGPPVLNKKLSTNDKSQEQEQTDTEDETVSTLGADCGTQSCLKPYYCGERIHSLMSSSHNTVEADAASGQNENPPKMNTFTFIPVSQKLEALTGPTASDFELDYFYFT